MNSRRSLFILLLLVVLTASIARAQEPERAVEPRDHPGSGLPTTEIRDGSFEINGVWREESGTFSYINCTVADCGNAAGAVGPLTGSRWIYFGGSMNPQKHFVEQKVYLPKTEDLYLEFHYWVGNYEPSSNPKFVLKIDGATAWNAHLSATTAGYLPVVINLNDYADGNLHTFRFLFKQNGGNANRISLDAVSLLKGTALAPFNAGFESGISNWTITNPSGDGVVCNTLEKTVSYLGSCAFLFKGSASENSKLTQTFGILRRVPELAGRAPPYFRAYLGAFVKASPGALGKMKVVLTLSDASVKKASVSLAGSGAYAWKQTPAKRYSGTLGISFVDIVVTHSSSSGKVYIDGFELFVSPDYVDE